MIVKCDGKQEGSKFFTDPKNLADILASLEIVIKHNFLKFKFYDHVLRLTFGIM